MYSVLLDKVKLVLIVLLALLLRDVSAQKYNIKTYSVNDGLPSSQVYDVHLDDNGYVWFATASGLVKFDGITFKTYDKSNGLKDELTLDIFVDSKKNMWASTEVGGVALFKEDSLIYIPELALLDTVLVNYISESPLGELWFSTNSHGVITWNPDSNSFSNITTKDGLPSDQVWDITFDKNSTAWIATMYGVVEYKKGEGTTRSWTKETGLSGEISYQVFDALDGTKWVATSRGITLIKNNGSIETITEINGEPLNYVYHINQDDDGIIWIGTERKGLYWFDGQTYTHITKKNGLSSNYIYRLIKAKDGTMWIATDGNGVNIFKDKQFRFFDANTSFGSNSVYGMLRDRNNTLWFGNEKGLTKYQNGAFKTYTIPKELFDEDEIWDIEEFSNGNLLLLSYNYVLTVFDGSRFYKFDGEVDLSPYYINDIYIDDNDAIYLGISNGVLKYEDGKLESYKLKNGYWGSMVISIFKDSKNNFWLGTYDGLVKFDGNDFSTAKVKRGIVGESIYEVLEDKNGNIWTGTNKGIYYSQDVDGPADSLEFQVFDEGNYGLDETIFLQFDENGGLWQGTNAGLNYYDLNLWRETNTTSRIHYALQEYGKGVELNGGAKVLDESGRLWFGSARNGLIIHDFNFQKENKVRVNSAPSTFIRSITANGVIVFEQNEIRTDTTAKVELSYDRNSVEFRFGAMNYADPLRLLYKYRLKGFEDSWNEEFNLREATYTNLKAGKYTFEVMAKSMKSGWSQTPSRFEIIIEKPFWLTLWFFAVTGFSVIMLVLAYTHARVGRLEKKKLKQLVDEQTKELTDALSEKEILIKEIHHRVKNNLAVISGLFELQLWNTHDESVINILKNSQMRIRSMAIIHEQLYQSKNFSKINLSDYMRKLIQAVSDTMDNGLSKVSLSVEIDNDIEMTIVQSVPCGLILNELLSNVYEHAFKGRSVGNIEVIMKEEKDRIIVVVSDDGIGMPSNNPEDYKDSLGLTLITTLIAQLNGNVKIANKSGTTFHIDFEKVKITSDYIRRQKTT